MKRSGRSRKKTPIVELFPPTDSTLREPEERATLDDTRLEDRRQGSSLPDQELAGGILAAIARDGRVELGDGLNDKIRVKVEGKIAIVSGVVDSFLERKAVEEMAEAAPGVQEVESAITVSIDRYLDDRELGTMVRAALDEAGYSRVGSKVSGGTARLTGTVQTLAERNGAVETAGRVKGIQDVRENLQIPRSEFTDDIDLASLVSQNLGLEGLVILDRQVQVRDGIVEISGRIQSPAERHRIEAVISGIPGVRGITNRLMVDHALFRSWLARTRLSPGR